MGKAPLNVSSSSGSRCERRGVVARRVERRVLRHGRTRGLGLERVPQVRLGLARRNGRIEGRVVAEHHNVMKEAAGSLYG